MLLACQGETEVLPPDFDAPAPNHPARATHESAAESLALEPSASALGEDKGQMASPVRAHQTAALNRGTHLGPLVIEGVDVAADADTPRHMAKFHDRRDCAGDVSNWQRFASFPNLDITDQGQMLTLIPPAPVNGNFEVLYAGPLLPGKLAESDVGRGSILYYLGGENQYVKCPDGSTIAALVSHGYVRVDVTYRLRNTSDVAQPLFWKLLSTAAVKTQGKTTPKRYLSILKDGDTLYSLISADIDPAQPNLKASGQAPALVNPGAATAVRVVFMAEIANNGGGSGLTTFSAVGALGGPNDTTGLYLYLSNRSVLNSAW